MKHFIARHILNNDCWVDFYFNSLTEAKKANQYMKDWKEVI